MLGGIEADVRRQGNQQAVDVDVQQCVDVKLLAAARGRPIWCSRGARCSYSAGHGGWLTCRPGPEIPKPGGAGLFEPHPATKSPSSVASPVISLRVRMVSQSFHSVWGKEG